MYEKLSTLLPNLEAEEAVYIKEATQNMTDQEFNNFLMVYRGKRRDPQLILLTTILGFVVIAGVQRILLGQIGMGILYLFTAGLCFIGTIYDLVNYKSMVNEYNRQMVVEAKQMMDVLNR